MSRVERYGKKRKRWRIVFGLAVILIAAYVGGMAYFHTHYYPKTKIGNIDIGLKSRESAKAFIKDELDKYTMTVLEKDGEEYISAKDAGLTFSDIDKVDAILDNQKYAMWISQFTREYDYDELNIQVDADTLRSYVDTLKCMNPETPEESVNASIAYNDETKKYDIVPERIGNIVDKEHFLKDLNEALVRHDESISLIEDTYYVPPRYYSGSQEVVDAWNLMNKYLDGVVTYKDGSQKTKTYRKDIAAMITCSDDFEVKLRKKKARAFVEDHVATAFNSLKGDIPSGITAWKVDVEEETKEMMKDIKSGKRTNRKPIYEQEGFNREEYDIGNTYIDVNISDQRMWYVEDGEIALSSDVVTGNTSTGHGTATGFFHIAYKQRDHLMKKYNSFVHYWMPYNTTVGIGFHDASWRSNFGGQIYRTNGSHGCINMPSEKAAALYNMIGAGTAVYVHW